MQRTRYHDMLRADIREHASFSASLNLDSMIARVKEREIELENIRKRKAEEGQVAGASRKKPNGSDARSKCQQGRGHCRKCDKDHEGV